MANFSTLRFSSSSVFTMLPIHTSYFPGSLFFPSLCMNEELWPVGPFYPLSQTLKGQILEHLPVQNTKSFLLSALFQASQEIL